MSSSSEAYETLAGAWGFLQSMADVSLEEVQANQEKPPSIVLTREQRETFNHLSPKLHGRIAEICGEYIVEVWKQIIAECRTMYGNEATDEALAQLAAHKKKGN